MDDKDKFARPIPEDDDVVAQVRAELHEGAVSPGQSRQGAERVQMKEMRTSRSLWVVRGLIGLLALLLVCEILLLQQEQHSSDVGIQFESGPTMEALPTLAPDLALLEAPPVEILEDPSPEILPEPDNEIMLPEPPTPTPLPTP